MDQERNIKIDEVKAVAAIAVVLIHVTFPGETGKYIQALSGWAVPFFFLVSGYYAYTNTRERLFHKFKHILKLLIITVILYVCWKMILLHDIQKIKIYFVSGLQLESIVNFLVFNWIPIRGHIWFLPALAMCYLLHIAIVHFHLQRTFYVLAPVILVANIFFGELGTIGEIPSFMLRNVWMMGYPYFIIGEYLHKKHTTGVTFPRQTILWGCILAGGLLTATEYHYFGVFDVHAGCIIISISIFMNCYNDNVQHQRSKKIACAGNRDSLFVYITHPMINELFMVILIHVGGLEQTLIWKWISPFVTVIASFCLAEIWNSLKEKLFIRT